MEPHLSEWTNQKSEWHFFDQESMYRKSGVKVHKCHLVAEVTIILQVLPFSQSELGATTLFCGSMYSK